MSHVPEQQPPKDDDEEEEEEMTEDSTEEETDESEDTMTPAELALEHKKKGNDHYNANRYSSAIQSYTEAIKLQPDEQAFYSNRAAAYYNLEDYRSCLNDCKRALLLDENYVKNYNRAGMSLLQMVLLYLV